MTQATAQQEFPSDESIQTPAAPAHPGLPGELNQRIGAIDADLETLRQQLEQTNSAVRQSLQDLASSDSDLTSQVSGSYQRLGELDAAYKDLSQRSTLISKEIHGVARQIIELTRQSETDIGSLNQGLTELVARTDELTQKSKQTTRLLNQSLKEHSQQIRDTQQQLLAEINELAQASQARDDALKDRAEALGDQLDSTQASIKAQQARLLKLQAVDQALERRADALEESSRELANKARELARSTTLLDKRTNDLGEALAVLQARTEEHAGRINVLEATTEATDVRLSAQIEREKTHFWSLGGLLAVVILAVLFLAGYETFKWQQQADANQAMSGQVEGLDRQIGGLERQVETRATHLDFLGNHVVARDAEVDRALQAIRGELGQITDRIDSLDGRLTNLRPLGGFGQDNQIHGPAWFSRQPREAFSLHLATVTDKQALYRLAERHGHRLQGPLAYLPVTRDGTTRYGLFHGSYASQAKAEAALATLPSFLGRQRPSVQPLAPIQAFLAD